MTIDKQKLKALAERAVEDFPLFDHSMAYAAPAVLALLAEIERLQDIVDEWRRSSPVLPNRVCADIIAHLKAENEALRKQVADLSPFKSYVPQDCRASNKCLACGEYHHGLAGLPCPKMTPVAQAFAGVNQRVVPVEPLRIPHPLEAMAKEVSHDR